MQLFQSNKPRHALLDTVLMLGISLLGIAAFLAILNLFIYTIIPTIPDVLTDVPTLYDYDSEGIRITESPIPNDIPDAIRLQIEDLQSQSNVLQDELHQAMQNQDITEQQRITSLIDDINIQLGDFNYGGFDQPNQRLAIYHMFSLPAIFILIIFVLFAIAGIYFEKGFGIFQKGTSMRVIKTSIIGIVTILVVPEFWDLYAIQMKQFSLYLMDPFNGDPHYMTQRLWCKMGCIVNFNEVLEQNNWSTALSNPSNFGQALITSALLAPMKAVPTAMITMILFVLAKIRIIFIMIILLTLPIWMVAMNLPFLKKHGNDMLSNMMGASLAPPFSALTLFVGMVYIDSNKDIASLEEWISVLGIAVLAALWPVILAPKLSIIASTTTSMVQTALQSGAMLTSGAMSGMGGAMAQSGAIPGIGGDSGMSKGMAAKTLLTTGALGASLGGANGLPGQMPYGMRNQMMGVANENLGANMASQNVSDINATNPTMTDPQISNGMMHNPGNTLGSLGGLDEGQSIANDSVRFDNVVSKETEGIGQQYQTGARAEVEKALRGNLPGLADKARQHGL